MASISIEEENYVRMSLLLTGISPRAVRKFFNGEFDPACLEVSLKKDYNKLLALQKKNRINKSQWKLLFPRFPDVPESKKFDITLMLILLRNLTDITNHDDVGFDFITTAIETTARADLARMKNYRNNFAHLDEGKVESSYINIAWNDLTGAIGRLGGQHMKEDCDQLRTKTLDQTNREIMMDIKRSNEEIKELKETLDSLKRAHEVLEEAHTEIERSHTDLKVDHAEMKKEMHRLKIVQDDTVPWNTRERIKDTLKSWKENDDNMFINTRASKHVLKSIQENSCVTITASSGVGKTTILRHVALQMANEKYDVLVVTDPDDIVKFYNPRKKTLFVIDDLCGNFSVDQSDIKRWEPVIEDIKLILEKGQSKLIAACRLQVYQDEKFESLSVFKSRACNLLSEKICLSKTEKQSIAELYLKSNASAITDFYNLFDCFPLLCKMYHDSPNLNVKYFFQNPFSVYGGEIDNLRKKGHHTKYCALALCVIFNNKLREEMLTEDVNEETRVIIENTCEACRIDRGTSRLILLDELDSLRDTFIKKEENVYMTIHDKIFDFLSFFYGQKIIHCLIKYADSGLIKERFSFESIEDIDQFITIVPQKYHQTYIQRMIVDWSNGKVQDVFSNINMKIPQFRQQLVLHLDTLDISHQRQLAHMCDKSNPRENFCYAKIDEDDHHYANDDYYDSVLLKCCDIGEIRLVLWCCNLGVDVNKCTFYRVLLPSKPLIKTSPLMKACEQGYTEIVNILLDREADYNKCDMFGYSSFMIACQHGHIEVVMMLLGRGADCNNSTVIGRSPVMTACENGHKELVQILLDRGDNYNNCDDDGQTPLMIACQHGHTEIVNMLLDRMLGCHKDYSSGQLPLIEACKHGYTEIVKILLDMGADYNECNEFGKSPLMKACKYGHTEVVKMLLDRGTDYNKCDFNEKTPLLKACKYGHTEIVTILLDKGTDCNEWDINRHSPVWEACCNGHKEIVQMLFDKGAEYDKCDVCGQSPVWTASEHGHTEIVRMLLDKGVDWNKGNFREITPFMIACENGHTELVNILLDRGVDCNKCDLSHVSPVIMACKHGHAEIVKILLERGTYFNKCDMWGQSSVMKACEHGHTEIVKMLLDKGADYNQCDTLGEYPVMIACEHGHTETVKMLLERGANYNKCNRDENTPFSMAYKHGHKEIVNMLLDRKAICNSTDE